MRTGRRILKTFAFWAVFLPACLAIAPGESRATELKPDTAAAFNLYVQVSEAQMDADLRAGRFLVIDRLADPERDQAYSLLQRGRLYIEAQKTLQGGKAIRIPGGLIHHWAGATFIPGATLEQADAVLKDFDDKPVFYKPEVQQAQFRGQDGDVLKMFLRLYYKSILTVHYNVLIDLHPSRIGDNRILVRSYSTRIAEVKNASQPDEHELPVGKDNGFLWRLYSYWRLEEKDGGVYLGIESMALSRGIPAVLVPLVKPLTESIPRKLLTDLLLDTRAAVIARVSAEQADQTQRRP